MLHEIIIFIFNTNSMNALTLIYIIENNKEVMFNIEDGIDINVDWGDGTIESFEIIETLSHKYMNEGMFTIRITGKATKIEILSTYSLIRCLSFGTLGITDFSELFSYCSNLIEVLNQLLIYPICFIMLLSSIKILENGTSAM